MILPVLACLSAFAEPPDLESRLLGDVPVTAVAPASVASPAGVGWMGMALALGAFGCGMWLWKRERTTAAGPASLRLVGRRQLPNGSLVLVDVDGLDGTCHRLLLGTGSSGPRLLADVSIGLAALGEEEP
jgi:hypothetical protein